MKNNERLKKRLTWHIAVIFKKLGVPQAQHTPNFLKTPHMPFPFAATIR